MSEINLTLKKTLAVIILSLLSTSCEISTDDNLPATDARGLSISVITNRHEDETTAEVSAAVYQDGIPVELTGGDLFKVTSGAESSYLKMPAAQIRGYAGSIETDSRETLDIEIIHDAIIAREDRWYPVDALFIDPGPGPLVGRRASASFPDPVRLTAPQASTEYNSIDGQIDLQWIAGSGNESMNLVAAVDCSDGLSTSRYGIQRDLGDDDGFEPVPLSDIIVDNNNPLFNSYIGPLAQVLLQQLLNELSEGNIDPDFVVRKIEANPLESRCEIWLVLQRVRKGDFDDGFDDGDITASSSTDVQVIYSPPALF